MNCDSSGYKGKWQSILGIKPGQKLSEVVDINQKEFTISGFGWAYGGHVVSWEGGTLNNKNVTGSFADFGNGKISDDEYRNISGDTEFNVSLDAIKKLNPTLKQVIVYSKK